MATGAQCCLRHLFQDCSYHRLDFLSIAAQTPRVGYAHSAFSFVQACVNTAYCYSHLPDSKTSKSHGSRCATFEAAARAQHLGKAEKATRSRQQLDFSATLACQDLCPAPEVRQPHQAIGLATQLGWTHAAAFRPRAANVPSSHGQTLQDVPWACRPTLGFISGHCLVSCLRPSAHYHLKVGEIWGGLRLTDRCR